MNNNSNADSPETPRTVSTPPDSAYGGDEPSRQGDGSSEWSFGTGVDSTGRYASAGHYVTYAAAYSLPPCSPVMHHRPFNVDYALHRFGQPCCCATPMAAYGHPIGAAPLAPYMANVCHQNLEQNSQAMMYPQHMLYASPYVNPNCCSHMSATCQPAILMNHPTSHEPRTSTVSQRSTAVEPIPDNVRSSSTTTNISDDYESPVEQMPAADGSPPALGPPSPREPTPMSIDSLNAVNKSVQSESTITTPDESQCSQETLPTKLTVMSTNDVLNTSDQSSQQTTYKASIRMDIPYSVAEEFKGPKEPPRRLMMQREQQRTTAFTIQFNDDKTTSISSIEKKVRSLQQRPTKPTLQRKAAVPAAVAKQECSESDKEDAVSETGTYIVDDEHSYVKHMQRLQQAEERSTLLKELMRISNGSPSPKKKTAAAAAAAAKQQPLPCKSGPASPRNRRSAPVGHCQTLPSETTLSNAFQRGDGGRFSMRAKLTSSPCRSAGNSPRHPSSNQQQQQGASAETLAWLRRKEYNPLKGGSAKLSTATDAKLLNSRSKSFHSGPRVAPASCPSGQSTSAKIIQPGSTSLKGQVFVQLGSLKKLQLLSVDLMTTACGLHERHSRLLNVVDSLAAESIGQAVTVFDGDSSCPLSDIIKKLTIVDRALKMVHQSLDQLEMTKSCSVADDGV